jgi:hypothetical protein
MAAHPTVSKVLSRSTMKRVGSGEKRGLKDGEVGQCQLWNIQLRAGSVGSIVRWRKTVAGMMPWKPVVVHLQAAISAHQE